MNLTWQSLGEVNPPIGEWGFFSLPSVGGELFRLSVVGAVDPVPSFVRLRGYYADVEIPPRGGRFYPQDGQRLIELPIPQVLKERGVIVRNFAVRRYPSIRWQYPIPDTGWVVRLEEAIGAGAVLGRTISERLVVADVNDVADLSFEPTEAGTVTLYVNGLFQSVFAGDFSISGKSVVWNASIAGFPLSPSDVVIAIYNTLDD